MAQPGGARWRNSPFARQSPSPSPSGPPAPAGRPKSALLSPLPETAQPPAMPHARNQSLSALGAGSGPARSNSTRFRSNSTRNGTPAGTFAPQFISDDAGGTDGVRGIECENDFSGKRYVWLRDPKTAFVRGWVVEERDGKLLVQCDDGSVCTALLADMHAYTHSNTKSSLKPSTRSTRPSSTRPRTWPSSRT